MSVTAVWDNAECTRMLITFEGRWSAAELEAAAVECRKMLEKVNYPVDYIVQYQNASWLPSNAFSQGRKLRQYAHPKDGRAVIVTSNSFIVELVLLFNAIGDGLGIPFHFARTVEEARSLLAERQLRLAGD